jgi:hypothetical protein
MNLSETDKKQAKILAGVVAGGLLLYFVFRTKPDSAGGGQYQDPTGNSGYNPGSTAFNAKNVATVLYDAMKDNGTDEEVIIEALKTVNQSQFAQVIAAFGKLNYNTITGNQYNFNPFEVLPKLGLKVWLKEELSAKEYAILKLKYPNQL